MSNSSRKFRRNGKYQTSRLNIGQMAITAWRRVGYGVLLFIAALVLAAVIAQPAHAQATTNTFNVVSFRNSAQTGTIADMTVAAQAQCNVALPCIIVFDPLLANFPVGTMPSKCSTCVWVDYTTPGSVSFSDANIKRSNNVRWVDPTNKARWTGNDAFAQANAAFADCSLTCEVDIASGTYNNITTTLNMPMATNGTAGLWIDPGAVLNYAGTGYAIEANGVGNANAGVHIFGGGKLVGTSSGLAGIHLVAFNKAQFYNLRIYGFANGDGWFDEGANTIDCFACDFSLNKNGVHNVGKVVAAQNFAANAVHFIGGQTANNTGWGVFEDGSLAGTVGPNENNLYEWVFETNGSNASPTTSGNMFVQRMDQLNVTHSYFESASGSTRGAQILLGDSTSACGGANTCKVQMADIKDNIFVSGGTLTNSINCVNCIRGDISGNEEFGAVVNYFNNGALSQNMTYGTNVALAATNQITGSGTYLYRLDNGTGSISILGGIASGGGGSAQFGSFISAADSFQGLFFNGSTNNQLRGPTGGAVSFQDEAGPVWGQFSVKGVNIGTNPALSASAPTLSGTGACATTSTQVGGGWAGRFTCTGTTGASTVTLTFTNIATNGYRCSIDDETTTANTVRQTGQSTSTCVLSGTVNTSDVLTFSAAAY